MNAMRFGSVALASALVFGVVGMGCSRPPSHVKAPRAANPKPLPDVTVTELAGGPKKLSEIVRGKVAVIDLWASWCTACRPVSARVAKLAEAHRDDPDLVVVGLDSGEDAKAVTAFLEGKMPPHAVYLDPDFTLADALGARELPAVVVVDKTGAVISVTRKLDASVVRLIEDEIAGP